MIDISYKFLWQMAEFKYFKTKKLTTANWYSIDVQPLEDKKLLTYLPKYQVHSSFKFLNCLQLN